MPEIDVHCPHCKQVIVPADRLRALSDWRNDSSSGGLLVIETDTAVVLNADFLCKHCGNMVYFRLNEQRLKLLLNKVTS